LYVLIFLNKAKSAAANGLTYLDSIDKKVFVFKKKKLSLVTVSTG
jgi:hypothetical protein